MVPDTPEWLLARELHHSECGSGEDKGLSGSTHNRQRSPMIAMRQRLRSSSLAHFALGPLLNPWAKANPAPRKHRGGAAGGGTSAPRMHALVCMCSRGHDQHDVSALRSFDLLGYEGLCDGFRVLSWLRLHKELEELISLPPPPCNLPTNVVTVLPLGGGGFHHKTVP